MRARDSPICIFFLLKKGMQDKKAIGLPILSTNKRTGGKAIMIRTKRILALFLAVVLIFSALPFSVSADELSGELSTESTVLSLGSSHFCFLRFPIEQLLRFRWRVAESGLCSLGLRFVLLAAAG